MCPKVPNISSLQQQQNGIRYDIIIIIIIK